MQEQEHSIQLKAKEIKLRYHDNAIRIQIQDQEDLQKFIGNYTYQNLPIEFKIIFETLKEFYVFLTTETQKHIKIQNQMLFVLVYIVGKVKVFNLPLQKLVLSPEEQMKKSNKVLNAKLEAKDLEINRLATELSKIQSLFEQKEKENQEMNKMLESKQSENLKLYNKVRLLENNIEELHSERCKSSTEKLNQSSITEEFTPVKKIMTSSGTKSKKQKELQEFGKKLLFKLDQNAKHKNKFLAASNEIQKLHGPTYQLYHHEALPKEGRFYFDIKIILIKNNNIVVGVITDKNKDQQFSFKKMNCVCYNGYDGSICQQDKQRYVNIKPKEGNKLRTVIDMSLMQIEWYMMGGQNNKSHIGRASIPFNMSKQSLYPYFQLYWQGNKIKLNP